MDKCVCSAETVVNKAIGSVGGEIYGFNKKIFVYIQGNKLRVFSEDPEGSAGDIPINYCPICGRELKKSSYLPYIPKEASDRANTRYA